MKKHRNKIDIVLRVSIAAISVLTIANNVLASSVVDSFHKEQVQHEFDHAYDAVDLIWDDSVNIMFYGQDVATVSEENQYDLVLKALAYYPDQLGHTRHLLEMSAATYEEVDSLLSNEIPVSVIESISDEELELNYREFVAMQDLEDQAEYDDIQDMAPSIGQGVAQASDLEVDNVQFVTSADENEQSPMTIVSDAYDLNEIGIEAVSNANAINQQADLTDLVNTSRVEIASHAINHNIDTLLFNVLKRFEVTGIAAVSAGDDDTKASSALVNTGLYINTIIGKASQKEAGSMSSYHLNSHGITIGFDTYAQEYILLGMSYTKADNHLKFSNNKLGNRSNVTSDFYTVYGQVDIYNKNIFICGIGIYGISNIKGSAKRALDSNTISSHKAYSNIIQGIVGWQYKLSEHLKIMPQLGIKYRKIRDAAYKEIATVATDVTYGLSVAGTKESIIETMAGFKVNYDHQLSNSVGITSVIYSFVHKHVAAKMPIIKSWIQQATNYEVLPDVSISRARLNFNYGTGFSVKSQNIEMGIFYNGSKARRYISHAGSIKLKINI